MLLCAGFGQRLRPLTEELPKPLMPVGDRSVLAHIADHLAGRGHLSAVANAHWHSDVLASAAGKLPITLTVVHEPTIRGVAGGIAGARELLEAPVVSWNGDALIEEPPLDALLAAARASGGVCLGVAPTDGPGTLGLDAQGNLVRVRGETHGREEQRADYVCLAAFGQRALDALPASGDLFADFCLPLLRRGERIETRWARGTFRDIGTLESYLAANLEWLHRHTGGASGSYVAPSALVSPGARLTRSVVGADSRVEGAGELFECVVWPGSVARAPLSRSIVTPNRVVSCAPAESS